MAQNNMQYRYLLNFCFVILYSIGNITELDLGSLQLWSQYVVGLHAQHFPSRFAYAQLEGNVGRLGPTKYCDQSYNEPRSCSVILSILMQNDNKKIQQISELQQLVYYNKNFNNRESCNHTHSFAMLTVSWLFDFRKQFLSKQILKSAIFGIYK